MSNLFGAVEVHYFLVEIQKYPPHDNRMKEVSARSKCMDAIIGDSLRMRGLSSNGNGTAGVTRLSDRTNMERYIC